MSEVSEVSELIKDKRPIKISTGEVCQQFLFTVIECGLFVFYLIAYFNMQYELRSEPISNWFLAHMVFTFVRVAIFLSSSLFVASYHDIVIPRDEWEKITFNVYSQRIGYVGHTGYYVT